MTRRGRRPSGTKLLSKFTASARSQARMRLILETLAGTKTIPQACAELGIAEAMFHRIRDEALQAALAALEAKPMGRPRQASLPEPAQIESLEQQKKQLEIALHAAELRAEIAQSMPHLLSRASPGEKKTAAARRTKGT